MLLRHEVTDGVDVLQVVGPVETADAAPLHAAVHRAVESGPRAVVIDLSDATALAPEAVDCLNWLTARAPGWPRPSLAVCCAPDDLRDLLLPAVQVHPCREEALGVADEHPGHTTVLRVALTADERAPGQARALARVCAAEHGLDDDALLLVVSELVTNAVRYGAGEVVLELDTCPQCVTVLVADSSPLRPLARSADDDAEGGRGLLLVDLLSMDHGVRACPPGKAVWAELRR